MAEKLEHSSKELKQMHYQERKRSLKTRKTFNVMDGVGNILGGIVLALLWTLAFTQNEAVLWVWAGVFTVLQGVIVWSNMESDARRWQLDMEITRLNTKMEVLVELLEERLIKEKEQKAKRKAETKKTFGTTKKAEK